MALSRMIAINAPIETVFACLDEEARQKQWVEGLESLQYMDAGEHRTRRAGAKFRERLQDRSGRVFEYMGELLVYQPPEQFAVKLTDANFIVRVDYVLTREASLTRLHYSARILHASWLRRFLAFCSGAATRRLRDRQLLALKALAEKDADSFEV